MRVAANFFSLALLELIGVKIPQSQSWVITDAPHPCTHTGSWITISFVGLIALLHLKKNLVWGGLGFCMNVQTWMGLLYLNGNHMGFHYSSVWCGCLLW